MARLLRLGRPRRGLAHAALGAFNDLNVAIDLGLIVAIGPCHHRPRLDRRPASTTQSTFLGARRDRASFVRDRRDAAGDLGAGYQRIVWICPLPSNEGDVFFVFSHVRAVSSRWGRRLGGFFIACHIMITPRRRPQPTAVPWFSLRRTCGEISAVLPAGTAADYRRAASCTRQAGGALSSLRRSRLGGFSIFYYCASKS